jgi:hypothetical protein
MALDPRQDVEKSDAQTACAKSPEQTADRGSDEGTYKRLESAT